MSFLTMHRSSMHNSSMHSSLSFEKHLPKLDETAPDMSVSKSNGDSSSRKISNLMDGKNMQRLLIKKEIDTTHLLSQSDAFINLCKCFSGASLFAMPWAFGQSGLLSASLSLLFLAFLAYFTLYWLAKCSHLIPKKAKPNYPDLAFHAFGKCGFYVSWIAIICMTVGVCGSYLVFIGSQLSNLFNIEWLTQSMVIIIIAFPMILLSLFRSYSFLVPFTILGLISLFAIIVIILFKSSMDFNLKQNKNNVDYIMYDDMTHYPLFLGNAAFAFLIHSVILPIEESMKDRTRQNVSSDYRKALRCSMFVFTLILLLFSGYGYISFGDKTCGNILNNLNKHEWYTTVVVVALCINLFFTYPLFLFPMSEMLEMKIFNIMAGYRPKTRYDGRIECKRNILRVCLVFITAIIAILIPDFQIITGLTGAFSNNVLGLILPPMMYFKLMRFSGNKVSIWYKLIGYASATFGILLFLTATYTFIYSILKTEYVC